MEIIKEALWKVEKLILVGMIQKLKIIMIN